MFTHGVVSQRERKSVLISPFHTVADAVRFKRVLNINSTRDNAVYNIYGNTRNDGYSDGRGGGKFDTAVPNPNGEFLPDLTSTYQQQQQQQQQSPRGRMLSMAGVTSSNGHVNGDTISDSPYKRNRSPTLNNYHHTLRSIPTATGTATGAGAATGDTLTRTGGTLGGVTTDMGPLGLGLGEESAVFSLDGDPMAVPNPTTGNLQHFPQPSSSIQFAVPPTNNSHGNTNIKKSVDKESVGNILIPKLGHHLPQTHAHGHDGRSSSSRGFIHTNRRLITHNVLVDHHSGQGEDDDDDEKVAIDDHQEEEGGGGQCHVMDGITRPMSQPVVSSAPQSAPSGIIPTAPNTMTNGLTAGTDGGTSYRGRKKQSILDKTREIVPTYDDPLLPPGLTKPLPPGTVGRTINTNSNNGGVATAAGTTSGGGGGFGVDRSQAATTVKNTNVPTIPATNMTTAEVQATEPLVKETTVVSCAVMLKTQISVLVGACSDKYLRFWSIPGTHTLCSCRYTEMGKPVATAGNAPSAAATAAATPNATTIPIPTVASNTNHEEIELCVTLAVNPQEELLIGGFDNGKVRVWKIILQSLVSLQNNHVQSQVTQAAAKGGLMSGLSKLKSAVKKGMAISPLTFLAEWHAHDSAIVNIQVFNYQQSDGEVFIPDKTKQKGLTFHSLASKKKKVVIEDDDEEDEDERQHRLMRAEIHRGMVGVTGGSSSDGNGKGINLTIDTNNVSGVDGIHNIPPCSSHTTH